MWRFQWVFSARNRRKDKAVWFEFFREQRRVGVYYFYILDPDFGPGVHQDLHLLSISGAGLAQRARMEQALGRPCRDRLPRAVQRVRRLLRARTAASRMRQPGARSRPGVLRSLDRLHPDPPDRSRPRRRLLVGAINPPDRNQPHAGLRRPAPRPRLLRGAGGRQYRHRAPRTALDGLRPPAAPRRQDDLRHVHLQHRHRRAHRLSLQALPHQAVPQGRPRAQDRDCHQQPNQPRPAPPPAAPRRDRGQGPRGQPPAAYHRTRQPQLCHRISAL